jgi:hypothetical protein
MVSFEPVPAVWAWAIGRIEGARFLRKSLLPVVVRVFKTVEKR